MDLKKALKELAQQNLMDYFAIAPVERMENAPQEVVQIYYADGEIDNFYGDKNPIRGQVSK